MKFFRSQSGLSSLGRRGREASGNSYIYVNAGGRSERFIIYVDIEDLERELTEALSVGAFITVMNEGGIRRLVNPYQITYVEPVDTNL